MSPYHGVRAARLGVHGNETDDDDRLEFYIRDASAGGLLLCFETFHSSVKSPFWIVCRM